MTTLMLTATDNATDKQEDTRRISEHDADFTRLHDRTLRKLRASLRQLVRDLEATPWHLRSEREQVAARFIHRHTALLAQAYEQAHQEGQRDYYAPTSNTPSKWIRDVPKERLARSLRFYALGSVRRLAVEALAATQPKAHQLHQVDAQNAQNRTTVSDRGILLADGSDWLASVDVRLVGQAQVAWAGLQDGYYDGGLYDTANPFYYVFWDLEPAAKHCFPAGTTIAIPGGVKPIEAIQVGDLVETLSGPRRVTRLFRNTYRGELVRVQANGREVACTPNHPFLTQRGWVAAEDLRDGDQVVLAQNGRDFLACHVRLPNANHGVTAGSQIGIMSTISTLLRHLALGQCREAWMPMPVVPVSLDDQRANADVNDELIFDDRGRLKLDAKLLQDGTQPELQFAGLVTLNPLLRDLQFGSNFRSELGIGIPPRLHFGLHLRPLHRVMTDHKLARRIVNQTLASLGADVYAQIVSLASHLSNRHAESSRNVRRAFSRIVFAYICNLLRRPHHMAWITSPLRLRALRRWTAARAMRHSTNTNMSTVGARLQLAGLAWLPASGCIEVAIPARDTAEPMHFSTAPRLSKRLSALFTNGLHHHSGTHLSTTPSIPQETTVYNFEVEEVHHYIAGSFVVHNCGDCPRMAANSPYTPPGSGTGHELDATPGDGTTECGAGCKCSLRYGGAEEVKVETAWRDYRQALQQIKDAGLLDLERDLTRRDMMPLDNEPSDTFTALLQPDETRADSRAAYDQRAAQDAYRSVWDKWDAVRRDVPQLPKLAWMFANREQFDALSFEQFIDSLPDRALQTPEQQRVLRQWVEALLRLGDGGGGDD